MRPINFEPEVWLRFTRLCDEYDLAYSALAGRVLSWFCQLLPEERAVILGQIREGFQADLCALILAREVEQVDREEYYEKVAAARRLVAAIRQGGRPEPVVDSEARTPPRSAGSTKGRR